MNTILLRHTVHPFSSSKSVRRGKRTVQEERYNYFFTKKTFLDFSKLRRTNPTDTWKRKKKIWKHFLTLANKLTTHLPILQFVMHDLFWFHRTPPFCWYQVPEQYPEVCIIHPTIKFYTGLLCHRMKITIDVMDGVRPSDSTVDQIQICVVVIIPSP